MLYSESMRPVQRGFTLIELLIVITILGILTTIAMGSFRNAQIRSRDAQRKSDLKQISKALELFYNDYEGYPSSSSGKIKACKYKSTNPANSGLCSWGTSQFWDDKGTVYFRILPEDPSGFKYYYRATTNQGYQLYAHLENSEDSDCLGGDCESPTLPGEPPDSGDKDCNFAVTSANLTATD